MLMCWGERTSLIRSRALGFVSLQWNSPPSEWAVMEATTKEIHDLITNQTKMPWIFKRPSDKRHLQLTPVLASRSCRHQKLFRLQDRSVCQDSHTLDLNRKSQNSAATNMVLVGCCCCRGLPGKRQKKKKKTKPVPKDAHYLPSYSQ